MEYFIKGFENRAMQKEASLANIGGKLIGRTVGAAKKTTSAAKSLVGKTTAAVKNTINTTKKSLDEGRRLSRINYKRGLQGRGDINMAKRPKVPAGGVMGPTLKGVAGNKSTMSATKADVPSLKPSSDGINPWWAAAGVGAGMAGSSLLHRQKEESR
ncbi:MAG: hypothetical protein EBZ49_00490 [Proteobacteria bacterium]|nr:hypothetical protein [Pseudomonadota bacterium]